ncbi:MAG: radical SAM protein [Elusimicrobiota bacterium]
MPKKKQVILIHVRDPQFYAFNKGERAANGNPVIMGFPPIGIMSLSAVLKRAGHKCIMFDQANPQTTDKDILDTIGREKPDLVGLSFLSTTSYPYAKILARQIRAAHPRVKMAFGGVFVTLNDAKVKKQCPEVDFICRGDGEQVILDLLESLPEPRTVKGITWMDRTAVVRNPDRPLERALDQWPEPDRESLKLDFLESMPLDVPVVLSMDRFTTMQTSRGCPFPCVFCDIPAFGQGKWRPRSAEHVVAELKHLEELGYRSVYFLDDNFLLQTPRIEKICDLIIQEGLTIKWACEGRVDCKDQERMFALMAKAGCRTLMFGIESGSQKVLDRLKKKQTLEQISSAVRSAKKLGIQLVHGFFVVGTPDETPEDMMRCFELAAALPLDTFGFNRLCTYRGTPLWDEYVRRGLVNDEEEWYKYFKCSEIDPTCMRGEQINEIRKKGFKKLFIYKLRHYPWQTFWLLRRFLQTMSFRDLWIILFKPFFGQSKGATKQELLACSVEHGLLKDAAAEMTRVSDAELTACAKPPAPLA